MLFQLLLWFIGLSAVVVVAGTYLSRFADVLAERTGVGHTMGGMLLLASATSLPELAVDCKAALIGQPDIAVGAVLGSSIFNLLILGTLDLLLVRRDRIISPRSSSHLLPAVTTVLLSAIVVAFIVLDLPLQIGAIGLGTLLAFLFYLFCLRMIYIEQMTGERESDDLSDDTNAMSTPIATAGYLASTIVILLSASALAPTAEELAKVTNLGGTFIGSTLIALTTSLPELVTTFAAIRLGAFDMAFGNILGSNAFNVAILFPVDWFYTSGTKSLLRDAETSNALTGSAVIIVTSIVIMALIFRPRRRNRWLDPGPVMVVVLAAVSFVILYYLTPRALQ